MKENKKIEIDILSKNCQDNIKVDARLPEILKMRSRGGGFVAWPDKLSKLFENQPEQYLQHKGE